MKKQRIFFNFLGYKNPTYHQTIREKWSINGCKKLVLDTIHGLQTYLEIECDNEDNIKNMAKKLNLDFNKAVYGGYGNQFIYYYGITNDEFNTKVKNLTFETVINDISNFVKKNKDLLIKNQKKYIKKYHRAVQNLKNI